MAEKYDQEEAMIERYISPGDKIEIKSTVKVLLPDGTEGIRRYTTSVYDILEDDKIQIVMPMEQSRLVLLPTEGEYDVSFFSSGGIYKTTVRIIDRLRVNGSYVLVSEMITSLRKSQRREYYRFNCIIDMAYRKMAPREEVLVSKGFISFLSDSGMMSGMIVDISGGGLRFISECPFETDSALYIKFQLPVADATSSFALAAKVIFSKEIENHIGEFENRLKFIFIEDTDREEIIKYIFSEDRKNRKNEKADGEEWQLV